MDEQAWLTSTDYRAMAYHLGEAACVRKLPLYACACCRHAPYHDTSVIGLVEGYADGVVKRREAQAAVKAAIPAGTINVYCGDLFWAKHCLFGADLTAAFSVVGPVGAALLRCIFGNPFRPLVLDPPWLTPTVTSLAYAAYEKRLGKGRKGAERPPGPHSPGRPL